MGRMKLSCVVLGILLLMIPMTKSQTNDRKLETKQVLRPLGGQAAKP